jgi:hypothetical protein
MFSDQTAFIPLHWKSFYKTTKILIDEGGAWLISAVVPWLVVIPFYTGQGLQNVMNWGSLFFVSITNFIYPFIIYIAARRMKNKLTGMIHLSTNNSG